MEPDPLEDTIREIHSRFKAGGLKLSVAESCTGGLIAHLITRLPGASIFFDSSVVSYSTESKIKLLGVKRSLIRKYGAVSEETAIAMARGIREKRGTDFSVSITGNLGPDPMEGKKVGLVYMAVDWKNGTESRGMIYEGEREEIKLKAATGVLQFLLEVLRLWA
jgi:nicotinamide-nucleotide amidase